MGFFDRLEKLDQIKKKAKKKKQKNRKERQTVSIPTVSVVSPLYRELNERNLILAVWDGEYGGVKASTLLLVFGRHRLRELRNLIDQLVQRNILVKDRNGWIHINPYHIREILEHYDIPFFEDELLLTCQNIIRRIPENRREQLKNNKPQW